MIRTLKMFKKIICRLTQNRGYISHIDDVDIRSLVEEISQKILEEQNLGRKSLDVKTVEISSDAISQALIELRSKTNKTVKFHYFTNLDGITWIRCSWKTAVFEN